MMGLKDGLTGMGHRSEFVIEFVVAEIIVIPGNIRLHNLQNVFGINNWAT